MGIRGFRKGQPGHMHRKMGELEGQMRPRLLHGVMEVVQGCFDSRGYLFILPPPPPPSSSSLLLPPTSKYICLNYETKLQRLCNIRSMKSKQE